MGDLLHEVIFEAWCGFLGCASWTHGCGYNLAGGRVDFAISHQISPLVEKLAVELPTRGIYTRSQSSPPTKFPPPKIITELLIRSFPSTSHHLSRPPSHKYLFSSQNKQLQLQICLPAHGSLPSLPLPRTSPPALLESITTSRDIPREVFVYAFCTTFDAGFGNFRGRL